MKRTEIFLDIEKVPSAIGQFLKGAALYDSSCSEQAQTLFVKGDEPAFLKITKAGSLEREYQMTRFLHKHKVAPEAIAYVPGSDHDYLLLEAVAGEDGTSSFHKESPAALAAAFGKHLRVLHSIPAAGCPYPDRTAEMLRELSDKGIHLDDASYSPVDNVIIHGDYCLPNVIMDRFAFKGFIDTGHGGVGDRHYDLYWGLWTLEYNFKTDRYHEQFLDAYGREDIDMEGLRYFTQLVELSD